MSHLENDKLREALWEQHFENCQRGGGCDCLRACVHDSWEEEWCYQNEDCQNEVNELFNR